MSRPDPQSERSPSSRPTNPAPPPSARETADWSELGEDGGWTVEVLEPPPLQDGDVECIACGAREEEDDAYAAGWRWETQFDGEARWRCWQCRSRDIDPPGF